MQQLTLPTTSLKKPLTPAEWLLHSMCWTLACVAGWLLASTAITKLLDTNETWVEWLLFGTAAAAHLLIWYKAVLSTWDTVAEQTEPFWLSILSAGWTLVLLLFQLACLALLFVVLLVSINGGILG
jgi:RsiW-degrading membrane proteinase PrsW (M82 family)